MDSDVRDMTAATLRSSIIVEIRWYAFRTMKKRGPKPIYGTTMKKRVVTLDEMTERKLKAMSEASLSAAIRKAADIAYRQYQSLSADVS